MANSFIDYTGNGVITTFTVPPYLDESHISAAIDGLTKTSGVDYTISGTSLTFSTAPANGTKIRLQRSSSRDTRLSDYSDASLLTADQLDSDANQLFYLAQESFDRASETNLAASTFYTSATTEPSDPKAGDLYFNTLTGLLRIYTGTVWESINNRGTKETFNISTSTTVFTVSTAVDENTLVFLNGVLLVEGASGVGDYETTTSTVTLNTAVTSGILEVVTFPNAFSSTLPSGIQLPDNQKAVFGNNGSMSIYSDGDDFYIDDADYDNDNDLKIRGRNVSIWNKFSDSAHYVQMAMRGSEGFAFWHGGSSASNTIDTGATSMVIEDHGITVGQPNLNFGYIGHDADKDLMKLEDGKLSINGELIVPNGSSLLTNNVISPTLNPNISFKGQGNTDNYVQFGQGGTLEISANLVGGNNNGAQVTETGQGNTLDLQGETVKLNTTIRNATVGTDLVVVSSSFSVYDLDHTITFDVNDSGLTASGVNALNINGASNTGTDWVWVTSGGLKRGAPIASITTVSPPSGQKYQIKTSRPLSGGIEALTSGDTITIGQLSTNPKLETSSTGIDVSGDIKIPASTDGLILTAPNGTEYKIGVDNNGGLTGITSTSSGSIIEENFTATAGQTVFTLAATFNTSNDKVSTYINGVRQTAFTASGTNTVTFTNSLSASDEVAIIVNVGGLI